MLVLYEEYEDDDSCEAVITRDLKLFLEADVAMSS